MSTTLDNCAEAVAPYFPLAEDIISTSNYSDTPPNILLFHFKGFCEFEHVSTITGTGQISSGYLPGVGYYFEYSAIGDARQITPESIEVLRKAIVTRGYKEDITIIPKGFGLVNWFIVRVYIDEQTK
ncbi:hypothetical protein [Pseudomonas aeruginosa]|uniref:hypothetical protein n=1 Tax=Pseudomonas aeruginosa TaxID=287 RepID=UPI001CA481F7|nr:hypothetical protein [Pseudomonas aeruginosa]MBW6070116.1 hypothetical protein [Pseudomonas aeruginosa]